MSEEKEKQKEFNRLLDVENKLQMENSLLFHDIELLKKENETLKIENKQVKERNIILNDQADKRRNALREQTKEIRNWIFENFPKDYTDFDDFITLYDKKFCEEKTK